MFNGCLVKQQLLYVKIWFIIHLKQPFKKTGCLEFQGYSKLSLCGSDPYLFTNQYFMVTMSRWLVLVWNDANICVVCSLRIVDIFGMSARVSKKTPLLRPFKRGVMNGGSGVSFWRGSRLFYGR